MGLSSTGLFVLVTGLALFGQTLPPNVCAVQDQYDRLAKVGAGRQAKTEIVVVNGRAVHSPNFLQPTCSMHALHLVHEQSQLSSHPPTRQVLLIQLLRSLLPLHLRWICSSDFPVWKPGL